MELFTNVFIRTIYLQCSILCRILPEYIQWIECYLPNYKQNSFVIIEIEAVKVEKPEAKLWLFPQKGYIAHPLPPPPIKPCTPSNAREIKRGKFLIRENRMQWKWQPSVNLFHRHPEIGQWKLSLCIQYCILCILDSTLGGYFQMLCEQREKSHKLVCNWCRIVARTSVLELHSRIQWMHKRI